MTDERSSRQHETDVAAIESLLRSTGIHDTNTLRDRHDPDREIPGQNVRSRGIFVRGARHGGSPFWNLLSRFAFALTLLILVGVGVGVWLGGRALIGAWKKEGRSSTESAAITCVPAKIPNEAGNVSLREVARLFDGRSKAPRDPEELARIGAYTYNLQGDRTDLFHATGARLVIRYVGSTETVRSISVSFTPERSFCEALQSVGLFERKTSFHVSDTGVVTVAGGRADRAFGTGVVSIRTGTTGIRAFQIARP